MDAKIYFEIVNYVNGFLCHRKQTSKKQTPWVQVRIKESFLLERTINNPDV